MKTTDYAGIDYGLGKSNIDAETGIRYGVIGQNAEPLNPDAVQEIWHSGTNLSYENYLDGAKAKLRSALSDYFSDYKHGSDAKSKLDRAVDDALDVVSDGLGDNYQGDNDAMLFQSDGYKIQTGETDLWILKSPFYTHAQFCSPCAPGAGNLDSHCADGPKTYCLGHDWFDDEKAPYPVYSVATGEQVNP